MKYYDTNLFQFLLDRCILGRIRSFAFAEKIIRVFIEPLYGALKWGCFARQIRRWTRCHRRLRSWYRLLPLQMAPLGP